MVDIILRLLIASGWLFRQALCQQQRTCCPDKLNAPPGGNNVFPAVTFNFVGEPIGYRKPFSGQAGFNSPYGHSQQNERFGFQSSSQTQYFRPFGGSPVPPGGQQQTTAFSFLPSLSNKPSAISFQLPFYANASRHPSSYSNNFQQPSSNSYNYNYPYPTHPFYGSFQQYPYNAYGNYRPFQAGGAYGFPSHYVSQPQQQQQALYGSFYRLPMPTMRPMNTVANSGYGSLAGYFRPSIPITASFTYNPNGFRGNSEERTFRPLFGRRKRSVVPTRKRRKAYF